MEIQNTEIIENHTNKNKIILFLVVGTALLLVIGLGLWYNNFKSNPNQNSEDTVPVVADFDRDLLSDDDEKKFGTDPAKADTDADGLEDSVEIEKGLDPKNPYSITPGVLDSEALMRRVMDSLNKQPKNR